MSIMTINPGQYVLGGISAPTTNISDAFQAGLRRNLERQDVRQVMAARQQAMDLTAEQADIQRRARESAMGMYNQLGSAQRSLPVSFGGASALQEPPSPRAGLNVPSAVPVGEVSKQFEVGPTGGVSTISRGAEWGDPGGTSYGTSQLSSSAGTMQKFLQSKHGQTFAAAFKGLKPGTPEFDNVYRQLAAQNGPVLEQAQRAFIAETHYQPVQKMAQSLGFATDNPAVQEALWSQSIQHSSAGNREILEEAKASGANLQDPESVIRALYAARTEYVKGLLAVPPTAGAQRYAREQETVLQRLARQRTTEGNVVRNLVRPILPPGTADAVGLAVPAMLGINGPAPDGTGAPVEPEVSQAQPPVTEPDAGLRPSSGGTTIDKVFTDATASRQPANVQFVGAPELVFQAQYELDNERAFAGRLAEFYAIQGNAEGVFQIQQRMNALNVQQHYLNGMVAVVGVKQGNFGPLQQILTQQYPDRSVEVRPYTDGTVEFFVDGESAGDPQPVDALMDEWALRYDQKYQQQQQQLQATLAERQFEMDKIFAEEEAQAAREIAVEDFKAQLENGQLKIQDTEQGTFVIDPNTREIFSVDSVPSKRKGRPPTVVLRSVSTPNTSTLGVR